MIATPTPYQADEDDPYTKAINGASDSNATDPNAPPKPATPQPNTSGTKNAEQSAATPAVAPLPPDPSPTLPPAPGISTQPASQPAVQTLIAGAPTDPSVTTATGDPGVTNLPMLPAGPSSAVGSLGNGDPAVQAQLAVQAATAPNTSPASTGNITASPTSADSLLPLLTGGAQGTNQTPLQQATTAATINQLSNPNPYNSDAVKAEYANLAGGIDSDYDARQRGLTDQFAEQGLSGSAGKDFASGRAADTEVGRRTAKEQLATNLADAQAKAQAGSTAQAISQGQTGSQQGVNNSLSYIQSLMNYGQNAFGNDLATSQFQDQQNNEQEQQLLQLLAAGYGA